MLDPRPHNQLLEQAEDLRQKASLGNSQVEVNSKVESLANSEGGPTSGTSSNQSKGYGAITIYLIAWVPEIGTGSTQSQRN